MLNEPAAFIHKLGVVVMNSNVFGKLESRLRQASGQAGVELFMHRKYSLPERPDVEIERTIWAYRDGEYRE